MFNFRKLIERFTFNERYQQRHADSVRVFLLLTLRDKFPPELFSADSPLQKHQLQIHFDSPASAAETPDDAPPPNDAITTDSQNQPSTLLKQTSTLSEPSSTSPTPTRSAEQQTNTSPARSLSIQLPDSSILDPLSLRQIDSKLAADLQPQIHRLFDQVVAMQGMDVYPSPDYARSIRGTEISSPSSPSPLPSSRSPSSFFLSPSSSSLASSSASSPSSSSSSSAAAPLLPLELVESHVEEAPIRHPDGFVLRIKRSSIDHPSAGFGVHVEGVVLPGTVVALYPGVAYFPHRIPRAATRDNDYLIGRYDGVVLDARGWGEFTPEVRAELRAWLYAGLEAGEASLRSARPSKYMNPYGIANYINHPPAGADANVVWHAYDFTEANTPAEHRAFIPNESARLSDFSYPQLEALLSHSIVFVASRVISDEELFLDYRLNPNLPYPPWYSPCDLEEARARWSPQSIWFA